MAFGKFIQGLAGNFSEQNKETLIKEYGQYLLENEEIQSGYKLIRDSIIFTNIRIIYTCSCSFHFNVNNVHQKD